MKYLLFSIPHSTFILTLHVFIFFLSKDILPHIQEVFTYQDHDRGEPARSGGGMVEPHNYSYPNGLLDVNFSNLLAALLH